MQSQITFPEFELNKIFNQNTTSVKILQVQNLPEIFIRANFLTDHKKINEFFLEFFKIHSNAKDQTCIFEQFFILGLLLSIYPNYDTESLNGLKSIIRLPPKQIPINEKYSSFKLVLEETYYAKQALHHELQQTEEILHLSKPKKTDSMDILNLLLQESNEDESLIIKFNLITLGRHQSNLIGSIPMSQESLLNAIKSFKLNENPNIYRILLKRVVRLAKTEYHFDDFKKIMNFTLNLVKLYIDYKNVDKNDNGQINVQEFVNAIKNHTIKVDEKTFIKDYDYINQDKDDGITFDELCDYLLPEEKKGVELYQNHIQNFFLKYDSISNKFIENFKVLDRNNDDKIDIDEFISEFQKSNLKIANKDLSKLFKALDADCSGTISFSEFYKGVLKLGIFTENKILPLAVENEFLKNPEQNENEKEEESSPETIKKFYEIQPEQDSKNQIQSNSEQNFIKKKLIKNPDIDSGILELNFFEEEKNVPKYQNEILIEDILGKEKPKKIPKQSSEFFFEFLDNEFKQNKKKIDSFPLELNPKGEVLTCVKKETWDFFDTLTELLEKDSESSENPENMEYILRSMKTFFLIAKKENEKDAPKFLKLNEMLSELLDDFQKHTQQNKVIEIKKNYDMYLKLKEKSLKNLNDDCDDKKQKITDLKKNLKEKENEAELLQTLNEGHTKEISKLDCLNNDKISLISIMQENYSRCEGTIQQLNLNIDSNLTEIQYLKKQNQEIELNFIEKKSDLEKEKKKYIEKYNQLIEKEELMKERHINLQKIESDLKYYEKSLQDKKIELQNITSEKREMVNKIVDEENRKCANIMKSYKEDIEIKSLIRHYNSKNEENPKELWKNEKDHYIGLLNEYTLKIEELESHLKIHEKRKLENQNNNQNNEEVEKLRLIIKKQDEKIMQMKLVGTPLGEYDYNKMNKIAILFLILGGLYVVSVIGNMFSNATN